MNNNLVLHIVIKLNLISPNINRFLMISDENDRSTSIEPYELYMRGTDNDQYDQRTRSLSVDSTSVNNDSEKSDTFNTFFNASEASHDFRRKPSRQNSYLEATKQIGGKSCKPLNDLAVFHFSESIFSAYHFCTNTTHTEPIYLYIFF